MGLLDSIRRWLANDERAVPDLAGSTAVASTTDTVPTDPPPPAATVEVEASPAFPYPLVTVHGDDALATWARMRAAGEGWPVVIGTDEDVAFLLEGMEEIDGRSPDDVLTAAATLSFPGSLIARRAADEQRAIAWLRETGREADEEEEAYAPPVGDWPASVSAAGFTIPSDVLTGRPHDRVHIALLPCTTGWEAMAHLRWGNWNDNPAAEYHVAALRRWHEDFGAELVGCSHDVINLRVATRPMTREAALRLARDQYVYCADIVDQGTETLSGLAAALMADDWWYFWWD